MAKMRPGDIVRVRGIMSRIPGPEVLVTVMNSRMRDDGTEEILAATREYGRRWFKKGAGSFRVLEG
jgi:hypothetical protein